MSGAVAAQQDSDWFYLLMRGTNFAEKLDKGRVSNHAWADGCKACIGGGIRLVDKVFIRQQLAIPDCRVDTNDR